MNYVTVEDVLALEVAQEWQLVAGKEGITKTISWIYVCQENEIVPWVQGREIMILYGNGIKRDTKSLVNMVEICAEKQLSGIIILMGHFFKELPQEMLDAADKLAVPIITMPASIPIAIVTKAIAELIMNEKHRRRQGDETLRDIIYGYEDDERSHLAALGDTGYKLKQYNYICVVRDVERLLQNSAYAQDIVMLTSQYLHTPVLYRMKNRIVALVGGDEKNTVQDLLEACMALCVKIAEKYELNGFTAAIGCRITEKTSIKQSYRTAVQTVKTVGMFGDGQKCKSYDATPAILQLLYENENSDIPKLCSDGLLKPLLDYDKQHDTELTETLWRFILENCNASRAAEKLYIHRNTMNNRLHQINDLLDIDLDSFDGRFAAACALYCYKYINMQL